jgi:hypothetical protein
MFGGYFETIPDDEIEMNYHFRTPFENTDGTLTTQDQVNLTLAHMYDKKMDRNKPLWYMIYIDNVEDGSSVLMAAIDHGIGDGASLVETLLRLADEVSWVCLLCFRPDAQVVLH